VGPKHCTIGDISCVQFVVKVALALCIISKMDPLYFASDIQNFIAEIKLMFSIFLGFFV